MPAPANPYVAGPPLGGESGFFGRDDIIADVERVLLYPPHTSVILYGPRRSGKTSLLRQLERRLPSPPFFTVYFDLAGQEMLPLGTVLAQMAAAAAEKAGMPRPEPATFDHNPNTFYEQFLPSLYQQLGLRLQPVFLLDEFDPIDISEAELPESCAVRHLDTYLYRLLTTQTHTDFVFAAGRRMNELTMVETSTFQPNLSRFVGVLSPADARALITQPGAPAYTEEAISRIIDTTRGQPYFTQLLCSALFARAAGQPLTKDDVKAAFSDMLAQSNPGLDALWDSIPPAERLTLAAAASRSSSPLEVISPAVIAGTLAQAEVPLNTPGLAAAPQNLVNWQLFEQSAHGYTFFTEFFRRWTAQNRPLANIKNDELARLSGQAVPPKKPTPPEPVTPVAPERPARAGQWRPAIIALALLLLLLLCVWLVNPAVLIAPGETTTTPLAQISPTTTPPAQTSPTAPPITLPVEAAATATPLAAQPSTPTETPSPVAISPTAESPAATQPAPPAAIAGQIRVASPPELQPVVAQLAAAFATAQPNVQIVVTGGSTQSGLAALQQGQSEVALVARQLTPAEQAGLSEFTVQTLPKPDPLAVIIHPLAQIDDLNPEQVRAIFSGATTNWAEVGGVDAPITLVLPPPNSDNRLVIEQQILGPDTPLTQQGIIEADSDEEVRHTVASTPYAIGVIPASSQRRALLVNEHWVVIDTLLQQAQALSIGQAAPGSEGYPLGRPLNLIAPAAASPTVQAWLEFVLSPQGQQIITEYQQANP